MFKKEEVRDLIVSALVITLIFSFPYLQNFFSYLAIIALSFILHELAHKFSAENFGCFAFYKIWPTGILFGLIFMFAGVKIVAPGAVVIYPFRFGRWKFKVRELTRKEEGIIAAAGPLVNLFFASLFLFSENPFILSLSYINAFLAFFNLLFIPPLDGSKIIQWKPLIWFLMFAASLALLAGIVIR
jgi:Zn-dependent protease